MIQVLQVSSMTTKKPLKVDPNIPSTEQVNVHLTSKIDHEKGEDV